MRRNIREATVWTAHTITVSSLIEANKQSWVAENEASDGAVSNVVTRLPSSSIA